ncbi:MAG: thioesterase family protein [bacterium]|nr:thioesterase family protein [bacterium]
MTGDPLARLLRRLHLTPAGADAFTSEPGRGEGRVFGGMLLAQGMVAAGRTGAEGVPASLHAHFLRPGRHGLPLAWQVVRLRDGWASAARYVTGAQNGETVIALTVSFTRQRSGLAHQGTMPVVRGPETLEDWEDTRARALGDATARRPDGPIEMRDADPELVGRMEDRAAARRFWVRPRGPLPDDPVLHAALLAYASDRGLLTTAMLPHGIAWTSRQGASLDHALWFHHPPRFAGWVLYATHSPVAVAGRALVHGTLWAADGSLVASTAQEGIVRAVRA